MAFAEDEFMAKVIFNVCTNSITHELCFSDPYHNQMLKKYILKIYDLGNILKGYFSVLLKKKITTGNRSIALSSYKIYLIYDPFIFYFTEFFLIPCSYHY